MKPYWLTLTEDGGATISLHGDLPCNSYYARKIWQALYVLSEAHTFGGLDNLLCDLRIFEQLLDSHKTEWWWEYHRRTGITSVVEYQEPGYAYHIKVEHENRRIVITKLKNEDE